MASYTLTRDPCQDPNASAPASFTSSAQAGLLPARRSLQSMTLNSRVVDRIAHLSAAAASERGTVRLLHPHVAAPPEVDGPPGPLLVMHKLAFSRQMHYLHRRLRHCEVPFRSYRARSG